ncbi:centromere protein J isoform X2 [Culex pipiens pallens]|uniref:centromere protein J isoform X2 n=1 Tax=Culex pipiens pallens TaxID=42434 RepID=UPI001953A8D0|nr:centromere protein J isoform X2 [Culex pipiens pallens]
MADSPRSILARLEQLKLWQEEQQQVLLEKQIAQRELLNQEQKKMYTILGIEGRASPTEQKPEDGYEEYESEEGEFEETNLQPRNVPARPFLKRGEGLKARALKKNPNGQEVKKVKEAEVKPVEDVRKKRSSSPKVALDINKVQQKKLVVPVPVPVPAPLISSETVDVSFSEDTFSEESLLPSIESIKMRPSESINEKPPVEQNIPWKQQLQDDASLLRQLKELKDLNLFEFLEQRLVTGNGSVASDASALLRLLSENSINLSDSTLVPATPAKPLVEPEEVRCLEIRPVPDPRRHFLPEEEDSESSDEDEDTDGEDGVHVRFASEDESEQQRDETDLELQTVNYSRMSTPKEKAGRNPIEESAAEDKTENDDQNRIREEMLGKSELLKKRLSELEAEIDSFRRENAELTRMKQEHELDKLKLEHEREEMMEKLNDERIKMEVYFHDERVKIEDQRQKALKEAMRPTKKEKEEILRLKEQVADLQKEMKAKEAKHASSQARFRSQIKSLEKDLKETQLELDAMKKDNKKLETENARLKRQNNSRMLLEINKNIAKLAGPPQSSSDSRRNSSPEKPRKAGVPSKMKQIDVVEKNVTGKVATAKVVSHPRSRRQPSSSESSESDVENQNHENSSDEVSGCETLELSKSSYFKAKSKKSLFNNSDPDPPEQNSTSNEPETAELIKNLKKEVVNADGSRDIWYPNGNMKKISPDGLVMRMLYFNKDIKETNMSEGTTKYYYFETNTWHTTYLDGLEILEFPDGQTEHRFKDGSTEVHFPNGSIRTTNPNSAEIAEEWKYADGSTVIVKKNDDKVITLPNGQVEIHTRAHKRRVYPDGTIKFLYPDGSQESRYSNGRVRLKDKDGRLISDTGGSG